MNPRERNKRPYPPPFRCLKNNARIVKSFDISQFQDPSGHTQQNLPNYINKLQSCCLHQNLAIGTENGRVYIYSPSKGRIIKCVFAEPWLSSIENCRGVIWTSGISRSLLCIRVKDNKKIFHTNTNTDRLSYNSEFLPDFLQYLDFEC